MNTKWFFALTMALCGVASLHAQGTAFTYQGRLLDQGNVPTGRYDIQFTLWDSLAGAGMVAGPVTATAVSVSNGLFTTTIDFGHNAFNGSARWLQLAIRTNGSAGAFAALAPRQAVTATPYSILAGGLNGVLPDDQLSANIARLNQSQSWSGDLTLLNPYDLNFGNNTRQMINLWRTNYGVGVQNNTLYARSDGGFAWFRQGQHDDTQNSAGTNGTTLMVLTSSGSLGIGTNTPAHRLDVNGNSAFRGSIMVNFEGEQDSNYPELPGILLGNYNSGEVITSQRGTNGPNRWGIDFYTGFGRRMSIMNNGRVGIGTTNPATLLDVNGKTRMTQFQLGTSAAAGSLLVADTAGNGTWQSSLGDLTLANTAEMSFGSAMRQMLNLWGTNYGVGVQANTLYMRSDSNFAWYRDGVHNDNASNPGAGGTNLMLLDSGGNLQVNSGITLDRPGSNNGTHYPGLAFGAGSGETIASKRTPGGNQFGIDFYTSFNPRMSIANNGNVGINTTAPGGWLDINTGNGRMQFVNDLVPGLNLTGGSIPGVMRLRNAMEVWPSTGGARGGYIDVRDTNGTPTIALDGVSGEATVKVLTITGGADIAEPFAFSERAEIPKGAVVVIDDRNPGQLKMSHEPYDTRVAGIVSGANGVNPGIALRQQGVIEGEQNVALTGRVYALADATKHPIQPGDLLTTSDLPGHAMKAADSKKAAGAIIGKAMTGLKEGQGHVLVLVSLQ